MTVSTGTVKVTFHGKACRKGHTERYMTTRACVTCAAENSKRYREANLDVVRAREHSWRKRNPEHKNALNARWQTRNAAAVCPNKARYRATAQAGDPRVTPTWADSQRMKIVYAAAAQMQQETGVKMQVDHVVPLKNPSVCGLHNHFNLRILPALDNARKGNRFVV